MTILKDKVINETVNKILESGFRAFVSGSGNYGFFTDKEGLRVICFDVAYSGLKFTGNYRTSMPMQTGTGWAIQEKYITLCKFTIDNIFKESPPQWATQGASWKYTTLKEHLAVFGNSSGYYEV